MTTRSTSICDRNEPLPQLCAMTPSSLSLLNSPGQNVLGHSPLDLRVAMRRSTFHLSHGSRCACAAMGNSRTDSFPTQANICRCTACGAYFRSVVRAAVSANHLASVLRVLTIRRNAITCVITGRLLMNNDPFKLREATAEEVDAFLRGEQIGSYHDIASGDMIIDRCGHTHPCGDPNCIVPRPPPHKRPPGPPKRDRQ